MAHKRYRSYILWIVIIISIAGMFFSPTQLLIDQLRNNLPWVAVGILISEILLSAGFLIMLSVATPVFIKKLTKSFDAAVTGIFHLKKVVEEFDWNHVAQKCNESRFFWFGFWVSVIGACGDGIVLILGIGRTLPPSSWGLMILPFWDLGLTYIIRRAIFSGVKERPLF